jgi:hypothetical protein
MLSAKEKLEVSSEWKVDIPSTARWPFFAWCTTWVFATWPWPIRALLLGNGWNLSVYKTLKIILKSLDLGRIIRKWTTQEAWPFMMA